MANKFQKYREIENLINNTLNVKLISEELFCCKIDDKVEVAKMYLEDKRFDLIGVKKDNQVVGYTNFKILENSNNKISYVKFKPSNIISSNTSLMETITLISQKDYLFVLDGIVIKRIVTKADVYKDPVRLFIYNLISNFEALLSIIIEKYYPNNQWKSKLTSNRLKKVMNVHDDRLNENTDFDLIDCLSIEDKITLFSNKDKKIRDILQTSYRKQNKYFEDLKSIRNSVAHVGKKPAVTNIQKILDTITNTSKFSKLLEDEIHRNNIII